MSYMMHYASPYYDPVKAHEYYEAHKHLKGRTSSAAGLNEKGREAASYVKKRINEERKSKVESTKSRSKAEIKSFVHKAQTEAARLRILLASDAYKNDPEKRYQALNQIKSMRSSIKKKINEINSKANSDIKNIHTEYENKYESELEKLKSDGRFLAPKSSKGSNGSKGSKKSKKGNNTFASTTNWDAIRRQKVNAWREKRARSLNHSDYGSSYLMHHGILGQRWGIRRYQNEDGTLTNAGKRRYGYENSYPNQQTSGKKKSSTAKKVLIGSAIVGGTLLAVYGHHKVSSAGKASIVGKNWVRTVMGSNHGGYKVVNSSGQNLLKSILDADIMVSDMVLSKLH